MNSKHWEFDSMCPKCGYVTHVQSPIGESVVRVHCNHCTHGYDYTHIVRQHIEVDDATLPTLVETETHSHLEPKIVILGAGYGGMAAAVQLQKYHIPFTLINKHDYHYFKTLLHEAAGGRDDFPTYAIAIDDVLRSPEVTLMKENVIRINTATQTIDTENTSIAYDALIIGLGSRTAHFNIPGLQEHSFVLNSLEDAKRIRQHIEATLLSYRETNDEHALRVVIGGGGLTGVELMGELADYLPAFLSNNNIPKHLLNLVLIHSHDDILPGLDARLRRLAAQKLVERGVRLVLNQRVIEARQNQVVLSDGAILDTQTFIWTGGVTANPLIETSGFTVDKQGRARVNQYLQSADYENVYVVGDCAHFVDDAGATLPTTGQVAEQMGQHAAKNLVHAMSNEPLEPFVFHFHGLAASLGPHYGVAEVGRIHASGLTALALKEGSKAKYLMHLGGVHAMVHKRKQWIQI